MSQDIHIASQELFESLQSALQLSHGNLSPPQTTQLGLRADFNLPLVGYLNLIHANDVQVIGTTEAEYLSQLDPSRQTATLNDLVNSKSKVIIIAGSIKPSSQNWWPQMQTLNKPVWTSTKLAYEVINIVNQKLSQRLLPRQSLHGVLMNILGMGVLVTGASGIGKSELAIELISRGHSLVADDMVDFKREGERVVGSCPDILQDLLEVRGLGIVNVRDLYGAAAIRKERTLRLIINLASIPVQNLDRVHGARSEHEILGIQIPEIMLPVTVGRNLALLVETAVRDHMLRMEDHNYHAAEDLLERQSQALLTQTVT